jgi:hypothetical protein
MTRTTEITEKEIESMIREKFNIQGHIKLTPLIKTKIVGHQMNNHEERYFSGYSFKEEV